jgi:hypothetical protein
MLCNLDPSTQTMPAIRKHERACRGSAVLLGSLQAGGVKKGRDTRAVVVDGMG